MRLLILLATALLTFQAHANPPVVKALFNSKGDTHFNLYYNVMVSTSSRPSRHAMNLYATFSSKSLSSSDRVDIIIDSYSWSSRGRYHSEYRAVLTCNQQQPVECASPVPGVITLSSYMFSFWYEVRIYINGNPVINSHPMPQNPSGERFRLIMPILPIRNYKAG